MMTTEDTPVLLPDLDGELAATLVALEEWAIGLEHAAEDGVELGLDAVAVRGAIVVLWGTASRAATDPDGSAVSSGHYGGPVGPQARLLAPDGRYEYEPVRTGTVDPQELAVLRAALAQLRETRGWDGRDEALKIAAERYQSAAHAYRTGGEDPDPDAPLCALAAVLDVLTLDGEDVQALRAALTDPANRQASGDVVLPPDAATARGRVADQITRAWYSGSALERWRMG